MRSKKIKMTPFAFKVIAMVKRIPRGKVATYGQIARLAGKPQGARGVGWILHACSESHHLPWQRVLGSQGRISFSPRMKLFKEQRRLLQKEGVQFLNSRSLDLNKYGWKKDVRSKAKRRGVPTLFS